MDVFGLVTSKCIRNIYLPFNARVENVLVQNNMKVSKNEKLIKMDMSEFMSQLEITRTRMEYLKCVIEDLKLDLKSENGYVENCDPKLKLLFNEIDSAKQELDASNSDLLNIKKLYNAGAISSNEMTEAELENQKFAQDLLNAECTFQDLLYEKRKSLELNEREYQILSEAFEATNQKN